MRWIEWPEARADRRFDRHVVLGLICGYPLLYALGYLSKSVAGAAAIWPANAITFAAFALLPFRLWALVALGILSWELLLRTLLYWVTIQSHASLMETCGFAVAHILTVAVPATVARMMRLFGTADRFALAVSPPWLVSGRVGRAEHHSRALQQLRHRVVARRRSPRRTHAVRCSARVAWRCDSRVVSPISEW